MRFNLFLLLLFFGFFSRAQPIPGKEENIPFLVTFGKDGETKWGDDDFRQVWFIVVPKEVKQPLYVRIFDPDVGNSFDELKADPNTKTRFSIYGGKSAYSYVNDTENKDDVKFKSGTLLSSKVFGNNKEYDNKWFTFGPINPLEGEYIEEFNGYVLKIVAEGLEGNDGNLYNYFISSQPDNNVPVEGTNTFTYEYTFRIHEKPGSISHIYPFVYDNVTAVKIHVFDLDDDAYMRLISVAKKGEKIAGSIDNEWTESHHNISEEEKKTSLDIQIIKFRDKPNNNIVISITNQYGKMLPFYSIPIGGVPKYKYKIQVK